MELGEMRCDSVVGFTRLRTELNGGHLQTPSLWLFPIMFLRLTYCGVKSKLHNLCQGSCVSKQIILLPSKLSHVVSSASVILQSAFR